MKMFAAALPLILLAGCAAEASAQVVNRFGIDRDRAGRVPRASDPPHLQRRQVRPLPKLKAPPEPYLKAAPRYGDPGKAIDRIPET